MIIGHLPAGYLVSKHVVAYFKQKEGPVSGRLLWVGALGAVAPDLDMLYFHLIDHRQHHHHTYWTHFPVVWVGLLTASVCWIHKAGTNRSAVLAFVFSFNEFVHMLLDSIVGDIWWFAPFVDRPFAFFSVPKLFNPWWLNFLFHWSFAIEVAFVVMMLHEWRRERS